MQLQPARARREGEGGRPRGRRHADGAQHDLHLRRHHDGHERDEDVARLARAHRRLDRARRPRAPLRRPGRPLAAATRRSPGPSWRSRGSTSRGSCSTAARSAPGRFQGRDVTIQDVFEAVGAHATGKMTDEELHELESVASPGAGACGGQFTANTMAMAFEVHGHLADGLLDGPGRARRQGRRRRSRPGGWGWRRCSAASARSEIITREGLENAIAAVACSGGSTNAVLHLLAVAREIGVELSIDDFDAISSRTPLLCDLKPGGQYVATDLYEAGGVPLVARRLLDAGLLHDDAMTVTGRTIGEHAREATEAPGQRVVRPLDDPIKTSGGLAILRGNLAPDGCVVKLAGHERRRHVGPGARLRRRGGGDGRGARTSASSPATSSSSATRDRPAARGCARCSPSRPPSTARASASTSPCSPTGASPARPTASWPGTSPPRPPAAARSPRCATATRSPSTSTHGGWTSRCPTPRSPSASRPTGRRPTPTSPACWRSTRASWAAPSEGAVTLV